MSIDRDGRGRAIATGVNIEQNRSDIRESALDALNGTADATHARDDALSPRAFEQLINASYEIEKDHIEQECRTLLYLTGRVGLRKGEVAHLSEEWVDWSDGTIAIPEADACTKGQHAAEPCGYCRRRAEDRVESTNITHAEATSMSASSWPWSRSSRMPMGGNARRRR